MLPLDWQAIKKGVDVLLFMATLEQADKLTQKGKKPIFDCNFVYEWMKRIKLWK